MAIVLSKLRYRLVSLIALLLFAVTVAAQSPRPSRPEFEVASIKVNRTGEPIYYKSLSNRFTAKNITTKLLLQLAWQTGASPISGTPDWFSSQGFDIEATSGHAATWGQMQLMLQSMLEKRFLLTFRRETKPGQVYALVVDRTGLKLKLSQDQTPWTGDHPNQPGTTGANMDVRRGSLTGDKIPMALFTNFLMGETGRIVINRTGLTGRYVFDLKWTPFQVQPTFGMEDSPPDTSGESLFTALRTQLGLKLESTRGPIDSLVVDHLERPSEN